ncbi:MAG TPA: DegT/DnrJ/EryC1/StrS family aminotransferase, partial [Thermoanaerobaculia bacterium]
SWFGFMMKVREGAPFTRDAIVAHLESKRIQTRMLFAGNLVRQPALTTLVAQCAADGLPSPFRIATELYETDDVMARGFWIGVYPGMTEEMRDYVANEIRNFIRS